MAYRSNAAEAWYEKPAPPQIAAIDLLPPASLSQPLWKSLLTNLRDTVAPEKLPPLQITSRPVDVGMLLGDRVRLPWFRTVFTNIGDVITPETLPPLDLESRPVDVGELITDQLSHFWFTSLIRNLADHVAPERLPALDLTAKPVNDVLPVGPMLLPAWSEVISTPKVFYPDKPKPADSSVIVVRPAPVPLDLRHVRPTNPVEAGLLRDLRRSRIRQRIWITVAAAQVAYLILIAVWPH